MTDEAFAELIAEHPDLSFELSALGELIILPPNYTWTGAATAKSSPNPASQILGPEFCSFRCAGKLASNCMAARPPEIWLRIVR